MLSKLRRRMSYTVTAAWAQFAMDELNDSLTALATVQSADAQGAVAAQIIDHLRRLTLTAQEVSDVSNTIASLDRVG
jgi:hypothetical protein